jgi:DNA-binding transcriptional ArsR family regulator
MEAQIFKALGDPLRLKIVKRLSDGSPQNISYLIKDLGITRQGARKQIQVLVSAEIIHLKSEGREVKATLDVQSLKRGRDFITKLEHEWDKRLSKLKEVVERQLK